MNNHRRPHINPAYLQQENTALRAENAALRAENTAHQAQDVISQHTIQLATTRLLTVHRRLQIYIQRGTWEED